MMAATASPGCSAPILSTSGSSADFQSLARLLAVADSCPVQAARTAAMLLHRLGSLSAILAASRLKLRRIGAEECHAEAIEASRVLIQNAQIEQLKELPLIPNGNAAVQFLRSTIGSQDREHFVALFLNHHNRLLHFETMAIGSATETLVDVKAILSVALLVNAQGLIVAHNHPSGSLSASAQDGSLTMHLRDACRAIHLRLLDHLIVSAYGSHSLADELHLP